MSKRIGILVFERFALSDVCLLADAFRLANEVHAEQSGGAPPYSLVMLSDSGGSVASNCSLRVWTDSLHGPLLNGFDTLFIAGGSGAAHAKHDSRLISRLRAVAAKVHVVRALGEGQALLAEADLSFGRGHLRTASSSPGALRSPGIYGAAVPVDAHSSSIAAALTVIRRDHGTSMAQRILERSTSSAWPGPGLGAMLDDDDDEGTSHKITAAAHWLCANYSQPISVTEAAQVVRMSTRNFLRRFKTQIGLTPSEYLLRARLDASCLLLVETDLPIDGIARRCGVSSGDGLAKIFRKRLSISPTDYRAAHRHGAELRFDDQ